MKNTKYYLINGKTLMRESGKFIKTVEVFKNGVWQKNSENAQFLRAEKNRANQCGYSNITEISLKEVEKFTGKSKTEDLTF